MVTPEHTLTAVSLPEFPQQSHVDAMCASSGFLRYVTPAYKSIVTVNVFPHYRMEHVPHRMEWGLEKFNERGQQSHVSCYLEIATSTLFFCAFSKTEAFLPNAILSPAFHFHLTLLIFQMITSLAG